MPQQEQENCGRRSFAVACDRHDPWGRAMFGGAHQKGEGDPADFVQARRYFKQSCALDPEFAACDFAKDRLVRFDRKKRRKR